MGAFKKKKRGVLGPMFNSSSNKKRNGCKFNCSSIRIGCQSNFWILGAQQVIWKQSLFGAKEDDDENNTSINRQQNNEDKKAKGMWVLCEGGFCVIFFKKLFCGGVFSFFTFLLSPKKKFITKNLVITYKFNTIEGFYHKVRFCHSLGFF